jgi:hypothetical protein
MCDATPAAPSRRNAALSAVVLWVHMLSATLIVTPGGDDLVDAVEQIRSELTLGQILDMVIAIAKIEGDAPYLQPILQAALDGLRQPNNGKPA